MLAGRRWPASLRNHRRRALSETVMFITKEAIKAMLRRLLILFTVFGASLAAAGPLVTVYKSPACGCCEEWVKYLRQEGFEVKAVNQSDLSAIKQKAGVKPELASCHTALVDGYVIEGHVPAGPIRRLLAERPQTKGLTVPGMPANSPGMGPMDGKLQTYTLEGKLYSTD
jgi:hypothetical protein